MPKKHIHLCKNLAQAQAVKADAVEQKPGRQPEILDVPDVIVMDHSGGSVVFLNQSKPCVVWEDPD